MDNFDELFGEIADSIEPELNNIKEKPKSKSKYDDEYDDIFGDDNNGNNNNNNNPVAITTATTTTTTTTKSETTVKSLQQQQQQQQPLSLDGGTTGTGRGTEDNDDPLKGLFSPTSLDLDGSVNGLLLSPSGGGSSSRTNHQAGWKNLDESEQQDFLKWLDEDDFDIDYKLKVEDGNNNNNNNNNNKTTSSDHTKPYSKDEFDDIFGSNPSSPNNNNMNNNNYNKLDSTFTSGDFAIASPFVDKDKDKDQGDENGDGSSTVDDEKKKYYKSPGGTTVTKGGNGNSKESLLVQLEAECERIKCNPRKIKSFCEGIGYIPVHLRSKIWKELLQGYPEVIDAYATWNGDLDFPNQDKIRKDSEAIARSMVDLTSLPSTTSTIESSNIINRLAENIEIVLTFYLKLIRSKCYIPVLGTVVGVISSFNWNDRASIAHSFHAMCAGFMPFISLADSEGKEFMTKQAHKEFKLIITYHSPILVQHLDRNCTGWEAATSQTYTELEREQHLLAEETGDIIGDLEHKWSKSNKKRHSKRKSSTFEDVKHRSSEIERMKQAGDSAGVIPTSWLYYMFSGGMPLDRLVELWDFYILRADRFFGFFLALAVFMYHKTELLALQGVALRKRMEEITIEFKSPYFGNELLANSNNTISENEEQQIKNQIEKGISIKKWCEEADRLDQITPISFRVNLSNIEAVARKKSEETEKQEMLALQKNDDGDLLTASITNSGMKANISASSLYNEPGNNDLNQDPLPKVKRDAFFQGSKQKEVDEIQKSSMAWQLPSSPKMIDSNNGNDNDKDNAISNNSNSRKSNFNFENFETPKLAMSIAPEEIVPQLCFGTRGTPTRELRNGHSSGVRFFGIDVRTRDEASFGKFPTAYHLEPSGLEDPDEIQKLIDTLESIKGSFHICLMGRGDESILIDPSLTFNATKAFEQCEKLKEEDLMQLNNCALFLMKKGFPFVSILDGGFAAVHLFLLRRKSTFGLTSLIDHMPKSCRFCKREAAIRFQAEKLMTTGFDGTSTNNKGNGRHHQSLDDVFGEQINNIGKGAREIFGKFRSVDSGPMPNPLGDKKPEEVLNEISGKMKTAWTDIAKKVEAERQDSGGNNIFSKIGRKFKEGEEQKRNKNSEDSLSSISRGGTEDVKDETNSFFVIGDSDEDSQGSNSSKSSSDRKSPANQLVKTEEEKMMALQSHLITGMQKGHELKLTQENVPGASIFPVEKQKIVKQGNPPEISLLPRYIVLTRERILVLETAGGMGSDAIVKSNHHITELVKMTFLKRDPEMVTLYYRSPSATDPNDKKQWKRNAYRLARKDEFIHTIQISLKHFR